MEVFGLDQGLWVFELVEEPRATSDPLDFHSRTNPRLPTREREL